MLNLTQRLPLLRTSHSRPFHPLRRLVSISLLMALLASCATGPRAPSELAVTGTGQVSDLEQLVKEGRFLDAALAYSNLSSVSPQPLKTQYTLRAAELLMDGNYVAQSSQLINEMDGATQNRNIQIRLSLLEARISMARTQPEQAMEKLDAISPLVESEPPTLQISYHQQRAAIYLFQNQPLNAARERVTLDLMLTDPLAIQTNQEAILSALLLLTPQTLERTLTETPPGIFSGWLELADIMSGPTIGSDDARLVNWRSRYPQHPALENVISSVLAHRVPAMTLPTHIALILPLNNRFAKAASAVRDGFLAAYYQQPTSAEGPSVAVPSIRIYDEGDSPEDVNFAYAQAISNGAEFVVGPLDKEAVNQLARHDELPVPVLALNFSETPGKETVERLPANLFQISLSPEQEAKQVAERAWLDGHHRAAIITPTTTWGTRVAKAFTQRWLQFGGRVVEKQTYDANESDYSLPIRRLLNVDESENRKTDLRRTIGSTVEFIPRRRQDIDFIFMAASSRQARLIKPQLRFHHAPHIPVYATSYTYDGTVDKDMDRDMDGVLFSDMPWTLTTDEAENDLKSPIRKNWPEQFKRYSRLYALGIDAYHIIGQLNSLRNNRAEHYKGETGDLSLDINNRLQRHLLWARFERGIPQVLNDY